MLYLLHGLSDDDTIWLRRTSIERYAAPLGLAVVMPQVHRSFYADEAFGGRYWTFLSEELPSVVASFFRVSAARSETFVAGLSMGGYGALKWALRHPDRFAAAASLSGAVDVERLRASGGRPEDPNLLTRVLGERPVTGTPDDLFWLLGQTPVAELPALWVGCGAEDPLYESNVRFVDACATAAVPVDDVVHAGQPRLGAVGRRDPEGPGLAPRCERHGWGDPRRPATAAQASDHDVRRRFPPHGKDGPPWRPRSHSRTSMRCCSISTAS